MVAARIIRKMYGTITTTRAATGSTSSFGSCQGFRAPDVLSSGETPGRMWKSTVEKMMTKKMATTNSGSDVTASALTDRAWSAGLSRLIAANIPSPTPSSVPMRPAATTSTSEFSRRGPTRLQTDWPFARLVPSRPRSTPENQSQYCVVAGLFSPRRSSLVSTALAEALWPSTAEAALPGSTWVAAEIMIETTSSVTTPRAVRVQINQAIGCDRPLARASEGAGGVASTVTPATWL